MLVEFIQGDGCRLVIEARVISAIREEKVLKSDGMLLVLEYKADAGAVMLYLSGSFDDAVRKWREGTAAPQSSCPWNRGLVLGRFE
jgi:hypothetical protein